MNDSTNSLGAATGGTVQTGNPQDIGSQNTNNTPSTLQSTGSNLFNGSSLRLTDQNGQPLNLTNTTSSTTVVKATKTTPKNHHNLMVVGFSGLIIVIILVITWLMTRKSSLNNY